jgi:hypothetical protein
MGESFEQVIREHLELKRRNSHLESSLPIESYVDAGRVFDGEKERGRSVEGAAFDTVEWKGKRPRAETFLESLEDVWSSGPVFDWGDRRRS